MKQLLSGLACLTAAACLSAAPIVVHGPVRHAASGAAWTDNFNRADGALGANWLQSGSGITVSSNTAAIGAAFGVAEWAGGATANNQYSRATIVNIDGGSPTIEIKVRSAQSGSTATHDGYALVITSAGSVTIEEILNDGYTVLATLSPGVTFANGDVAELRVTGTTLQAYKNGSPAGSSTSDGTYSSGQPGFNLNNAGAIDNWEGGDL